MSQMNLLPEYYVKQRFRNRVDMLCVILFTLVMGGIIFVGTMQGRKYRETQAQYEAVTQQFNQETSSMDEFMRLRGKKRSLLNDAKQVSQLEEKLPRSYLLAMVTHSLPDKTSLTVVEISEKISITADMNRKSSKGRGAKPGRGKTQITKSTDVQQEEAPQPLLMVRIGGYAANDTDVAQMYTTLKSYPITKEVLLHHIQEGKAQNGSLREFQIDWTVQGDVDVLDHLTEDVGIVEASKASDTAADQKEADQS